MDKNTSIGSLLPWSSNSTILSRPILASNLLKSAQVAPYRIDGTDSFSNNENYLCNLDINGEINHHIPDVKSKLECKYPNLDASLSGRYHPHSSELGGSIKFKSLPSQPSIGVIHNFGNSNTNFSLGNSFPLGPGQITTSVGGNTSGAASAKLGWGYHF
ncbi:MAG: hypothetical protein ABF697_03520 [Zymomonas mobilis]|uniref:hypothetical protein n=1 Tax=Zymomonas mobilis TaxID=542 RepID=UPI0039E7CD8C